MERYATLGATTDEFSPVYTQFLDCVHQIRLQDPDKFEFTDAFLVALARLPHDDRFTTFLCNSEKERSDLAQQRSVWMQVLCDEASYINPSFSSITTASCIVFNTDLPCTVFTALHCPWLSELDNQARRG